jgi:hypothetical protein
VLTSNLGLDFELIARLKSFYSFACGVNICMVSIGCELEKFPFGISQLHKHM